MHTLIISLLMGIFSILPPVIVPETQLVLVDGLYYTDASQTTLYTGHYREFFESGELHLEIFLKNGRPAGTYIVYFLNGKPEEIRNYVDGVRQGLWRTYNESGALIAEAWYNQNQKDGTWYIWDDAGIMRYEMHYKNGAKCSTWYMWDEKGRLLSEKHY